MDEGVGGGEQIMTAESLTTYMKANNIVFSELDQDSKDMLMKEFAEAIVILKQRCETLEYDIQNKKDYEPEKWVYGVDY